MQKDKWYLQRYDDEECSWRKRSEHSSSFTLILEGQCWSRIAKEACSFYRLWWELLRVRKQLTLAVWKQEDF